MICPETNRIWSIVGLVALIGIFVLLQCSCNNNKAIASMADTLKVSDKKQDKLIAKVEGTANEIKTVKTDIKTVIQTTEKTSQQIQQGFGVKARDIGEVNSKVDNSQNSTLLMIVLFGMNITAFVVLLIWMKRK